MATIAAGTSSTLYIPIAQSLTITPGTSGKASLNGRNQDGSAITPQEIYAATTIELRSGATITVDAINVDATCTDVADSLSSVSGGGLSSARMRAAARKILLGVQPVDLVLMGDSTGDEESEWYRLLGSMLAGGAAAGYSIAYRPFSDARQQYSSGSATYIQTGAAGRRYISAGAAATSHRIELTDSAATSPTGDLDVRALINLSGGTFAAQWAVAAKFGNAGARSWRFEVTTDNKLFFEHSADGTTQINRNSGTSLSGAQLTDDIWIRVTLDVDNGAAGNTATFYTSSDGATWTILGVASTLASTTALFDTATPLQWIGRGGASISNIGKNVKFYELQVYGALDSTAMAAWVDAGSITPRTTMTSISYADDVGNPGTVFFQGSTVVGAPRICLFNGSVAGQVIAYASDSNRFAKLAAGTASIVFVSFSHNEGNTVSYRAAYKTLTDLIVAKWPDVAIAGVLQNKRQPPAGFYAEHEIRLQQIAEFCASQGFDVVDWFGIVDAAEMKVDGIHPDPATGVEAAMAGAAYGLISSSIGRWVNPS